MMKKKIAAMLCAAIMTFGAAGTGLAELGVGLFPDSSITASAAGGGIQVFVGSYDSSYDVTKNYTVNKAKRSGGYIYLELDDGTVQLVGYETFNKKLTVPSTIAGKKVSEIYLNSQLAPDMTDIEEIVLPSSVKITNKYAVFGTKWYSGLGYTDGFKIVNGCLLEASVYDEKVEIPAGVTHICDNVFRDFSSDGSSSNLKEVVIPESVEFIGYGAFDNCRKLEKVNIPSGIKAVDLMAFTRTKWLSEQLKTNKFLVVNGVLIASNLSETGSNDVPDAVNYIADCYSLIDYYETKTVDNLKLPKGITKYGEAQMAYLKARNIEIPGTAVTLGSFSFAGSSVLKSVKLNEGTKTIGEYAFITYSTGSGDFTGITIPKSVTSIGPKAIGYQANTTTRAVEKIPGFKIRCYKDSEGMKYAQANGFDYEILEYELPEDTMKLGDANDDNSVDQGDLALIQQYVAGWNLPKFDRTNADVNCDGSVNGEDIALMQKHFAGWNVKFGKA